MEWKPPCYWRPLSSGSNMCSVFRQTWSPESWRTSFSTATCLERDAAALRAVKVCGKLQEKPGQVPAPNSLSVFEDGRPVFLLLEAAVSSSFSDVVLLRFRTWSDPTVFSCCEDLIHTNTLTDSHTNVWSTVTSCCCGSPLWCQVSVWEREGVCELMQARFSVHLDRLWGQNSLHKWDKSD